MLLRTALTGICQVDLILLWGRVPRLPAISILYGSVITGFVVSVGLVIEPTTEVELLGNLVTDKWRH